VRQFRLFRTTSFRLVAIYLAVFTLSVLILGVVVYLSVGREIEIEFDERVTAEMHALHKFSMVNGMDRLAERIRYLTSQAGELDYRLEDSAGRVVAGNLPSIKAKDGTYSDGWVRISEPDNELDPDDDEDWERALVSTLDAGGILVVGHGLGGVAEARHAILIAFTGALVATLALGTAGGLIISTSFLGRLDGMSRAAEGIMAGDLRQRIPEINANDDLGRLANTFNRMFDRIERLIEANRHVSHDIAHDLRKPLSRIVRRLEAARSSAISMQKYEEAVDAAIADVYGVLETFNALLRIAQIETGARRAGFRPLDLAAIARDVAEAFQPAADEEGKTLTIDLLMSLPVAGDRELLSQMVANLTDNALRHTMRGARIDVRTARLGDVVALVIADNGSGVPEKKRGRIFERFYRLDASRTTPGDGLGLSLVAAIAELHEIRIVVEDNQPGLRVSLRLPAFASG
jgi:signal transduction histidine kinase